MTQHWLDGFRMTDPDGGRPSYLWKALFSLDWWLWQVQLKTARMLCRLQGHRLEAYPLPVNSPLRNDGRLNGNSTTCTRCDWYE